MSTCKWNGLERPRILGGRHDDDCRDETCLGCLVCTEPHCRVCRTAHSDGTCPECLAETREALRDIGRMCDALPEEVESRGVEGEAMFLLGPAADPEARGHLEASVAAGRVPAEYLADAVGETHPLWVLGTWDMVVRDALDHDAGDERLTIATALDYLDRQLTYLGGYEHLPFEDMARDLRRCRTHLESVLHDGEQVDRGAPCMTCQKPLTRVWGDDEGADGWECRRCRERSSEAQYRFAVAHLHREEATHLTDRDMEIRTGIKAGTVRVWANRGLISRRRDSGRTLYAVEEVLDVARDKGLVA